MLGPRSPVEKPYFRRRPVGSQDNSQLPGNGPAHGVCAQGRMNGEEWEKRLAGSDLPLGRSSLQAFHLLWGSFVWWEPPGKVRVGSRP